MGGFLSHEGGGGWRGVDVCQKKRGWFLATGGGGGQRGFDICHKKSGFFFEGFPKPWSLCLNCQ